MDSDRLSSTSPSTSWVLTATPSMLHAHASHPQIQPIAPTPERMAKSEIRRPVVDQDARRLTFEVVDPIAKLGEYLPQHLADVLKDYVRVRAVEETASLARSSYEPRVDNGGWRSHGGLDGLPKEFHEECGHLAQMHRRLSPQMREFADALADAVTSPRISCPFEKAIQRLFPYLQHEAQFGAAIASLHWLADELQLARRMMRKDNTDGGR